MTDELLPILQYRDQILDAGHSHPVVVVTAETGAGKSTQAPQFLAGAGYQGEAGSGGRAMSTLQPGDSRGLQQLRNAAS